MSATEKSDMHKHKGPRYVLDVSTWKQCRGTWPHEFQAKLHACGNVLGLDMEWAPDRCPQHNHKVALMQLAVGDTVWLIRTCQIGLPQVVEDMLRNGSVIKVVAGFDSCDRDKLATSFGIKLDSDLEMHGYLDISKLAQECGFNGCGLKKLAERYHYYIEKSRKMSTSNWESSKLSDDQQQYAADDAYFSLLVATALLEDRATKKGLSEFHRRAMGCLTGITHELQMALHIEDCSDRQATHRAFWENLSGAVYAACETLEQPMLPHSQVMNLQDDSGTPFHMVAATLGVSLASRSLQEQFIYFAVSKRKDQVMVRARTTAERSPPSQEEIELPWVSDGKEAFKKWMALQVAGNLSEAQLKGRLRLLARWFEAHGDSTSGGSVNVISMALSDKNVDAVLADDAMLVSKKETQSKSCFDIPNITRAMNSSSDNVQNKTQFDQERSVRFSGLPPDWSEDDFVTSIVNLIGECDALLEWRLFPWKKGNGRRKALAMFEKPSIAEKILIQSQVRLADSTVSVERLKR